MRAGWAALLAVVLALSLQTTVVYLTGGNRPVVDLVLVVVLYAALSLGPMAGLWTGTLAGIVQDALSGGIVGVGGLSKSVVGFLAGAIGRQFIVVNPLPRFVVFAGGSLLHAACFLGLYQLIDPAAFPRAWVTAVTQAVVNGLVGITAFQVVERGPDWWHRRRLRRASLRR